MKQITLFLCFLLSASFTYASNPDVCDYKVTKVNGTQDATHAGTRTSDILIKLVDRGSVSLLATCDGDEPCGEEPCWSGEGVKGECGSLAAKWSGINDSIAIASACGGYSSLEIKVYDPLESEISISTESAGTKKVTEQITQWMTKYSKQPVWKFSGGIKGSLKRCDFYNDAGKIGRKADAKGFIKIEAPAVSPDFPDLPTGIPGLYWKPIAKFSPFVFQGEAGGEFNEEKASPWVQEFKGEIAGSVGVTAGVELGAGKDDVAEASISATGSCNLKGTITLGSQNRSLTLDEYKVEIGKLKGQVTLTIKLIKWVEWETKLAEHEFWDGITLPSQKSPAQPVALFTIPNPE